VLFDRLLICRDGEISVESSTTTEANRLSSANCKRYLAARAEAFHERVSVVRLATDLSPGPLKIGVAGIATTVLNLQTVENGPFPLFDLAAIRQ